MQIVQLLVIDGYAITSRRKLEGPPPRVFGAVAFAFAEQRWTIWDLALQGLVVYGLRAYRTIVFLFIGSTSALYKASIM